MMMETAAKPKGRVRRGWEITKSAWQVLKLDKELVILPILSSVFSLLAIIGVVALALLGTHHLAGVSIADTISTAAEEESWSYAALFAIYLLTAFIVNFFGAAITFGAIERFRGNDPTIRKSIAAAKHHIASIAGFSLLTATIGFVLQALEERVPFAGKIAIWLVHASWSVASMFAIPVIVMSDKPTGPIEAARKSVDVIKKTWGEAAVSQIGIGFIQMISIFGWISLYLAVITVIGVTRPTAVAPAVIGMTAFTVLGLLVTSIVFSALSSIAKAAVYHYATTGESPEMFNKQLMRDAMTAKKARKIFA